MANCYYKKNNYLWIIFLIIFPQRIQPTKYVATYTYNIAPTGESEFEITDHDEVVQVIVKSCEMNEIVQKDIPYLVGIRHKKNKKSKKLRLRAVRLSYSGEYLIFSKLNSTHHYIENYYLIVYDSAGPSLSPTKLLTDKTYNLVASLLFANKQHESVTPNVTHVWSLGGILLTAKESRRTEGCPSKGESVLRLNIKRYLGGQNLSCQVTLQYGYAMKQWTLNQTIYAPVLITRIESPTGDFVMSDSIQLTCLIDFHQFPVDVFYTWYIEGKKRIPLSSIFSTVTIQRSQVSSGAEFVMVGCDVSNSISMDSRVIRIDIKNESHGSHGVGGPHLSKLRGKLNRFTWVFMGVGFALFGLVVMQSLYCISRRKLRTTVHSVENRYFEMNWGRCSEWRLKKEVVL